MKKIFALVAVLLLLVTGGLAVADVPHSTTGVITSCYTDHAIRIIDKENGASCVTGETELDWNQTGPTGPSDGYDSGLSGIVSVPSGSGWVTVQSDTLPAGSYILNAVASINSGSGSGCRLFDGTNEIDFRSFAPVSGTGNSNPIGSVTLGSETSVTLECSKTVGSYQVKSARITAIKVGTLH